MAFDLKLTTAMAAALLASGCNRAKADDNWTTDRDTAICTDAQGVRLPDDRCRQHRVGGGGGGFWEFLGCGRAIPRVGERPTAGGVPSAYAAALCSEYRQRSCLVARSRASACRQACVQSHMSRLTIKRQCSWARSAAVSRGGFGSSARRFGSIHA